MWVGPVSQAQNWSPPATHSPKGAAWQSPGQRPIGVNLRSAGPHEPQSGGRMWPTARAVGRHVPLTFTAPAGAADQQRIVLSPLRG